MAGPRTPSTPRNNCDRNPGTGVILLGMCTVLNSYGAAGVVYSTARDLNSAGDRIGMLQPKTYKGLIPFELYLELSNKLPQRLGESDQQWVARIKLDPTFAQKMFGTGQFKMELMQAVQRREMAQAGARR